MGRTTERTAGVLTTSAFSVRPPAWTPPGRTLTKVEIRRDRRGKWRELEAKRLELFNGFHKGARGSKVDNVVQNVGLWLGHSGEREEQ